LSGGETLLRRSADAQLSAKALLLFAALPGATYATRRIDWRAPRGSPAA
jgi:inner membrane protein involved in colicin E2 resistance